MFSEAKVDPSEFDLARQYDRLRARRLYYQHLLAAYAHYGPLAVILERIPESCRGFVHRMGNALHKVQGHVGELMIHDAPRFQNLRAVARAQALCQCCGWRLYALTEVAPSPATKASPVDLPLWLATNLDTLESCCPEGVDLSFATKMRHAMVPNYDNALQLALASSVFNAFAMASQTAEGQVRVSLQPSEDDAVVIAIRDNGPRLSDAALARCFDIRWMLNGHRYGLGAAVARKIVEKHGGRLRLDSSAGCGTTVTLALPLRAATPTGESEAALVIALESLHDEIRAYEKEIESVRAQWAPEPAPARVQSVFWELSEDAIDFIVRSLTRIQGDFAELLAETGDEAQRELRSIVESCDACLRLLDQSRQTTERKILSQY